VARSIWKGVVSFGMVSIPVRLFAATEDKDVSFHQLHKEDHSRIRYKKWCPEDDEEVPQDEIVRAYEVAKDKYVELTDEDLDKLPLPSKHTIELSAFVQADEIDPIYYQKTYYLEPEETGRKPYALLVKVLESKGATGVAKIALRNKEHLCALRPVEGSLILETLHYPDEIREHEESPPKVTVNEREVAMAGSLVDALTEPFDPSKYHDNYREAVLELIESKTEGREVVEPEGSEPGKVTDLMAALRASVESARKGGGGAKAGGHTAKPKSKAKPKTTATKKRKSAA
jgi:DNA end-binding protein Ku